MADVFKKIEDDILEHEIKHDEIVIDKKRGREDIHEEELAKDSSKFMKDVRSDEIKHDEKVIARKEADAARHEAKLKANEQAIAKDEGK
jgi:hypothetical protein